MLPRILSTTIGRHRLERPRSAVFRVGRADCHLLPVGRADCHLLPRILSTNSGPIDWSSRILRLRTPPSASRPPPLSGGAFGQCRRTCDSCLVFGEPLCSNRLRPSHTTLGEPHCSNPLYPTRDSFGELHCSNAFCYVDHSVFRVGPGEAQKRVRPDLLSTMPCLSYRCTAAGGAGHCPVKKAASPAFPCYS